MDKVLSSNTESVICAMGTRSLSQRFDALRKGLFEYLDLVKSEANNNESSGGGSHMHGTEATPIVSTLEPDVSRSIGYQAKLLPQALIVLKHSLAEARRGVIKVELGTLT